MWFGVCFVSTKVRKFSKETNTMEKFLLEPGAGVEPALTAIGVIYCVSTITYTFSSHHPGNYFQFIGAFF
jgi:hypothetical protein